jgi:hypothetical protein
MGASVWAFGAAFFFPQPQISSAARNSNAEARMLNDE